MSDAPLRLRLEIDRQTPLEGHLTADDGTERSFAGWAGLASALTTYLEDWEPNPPEPAPDA
jgi:hypothetical protein